MPQAHQLPRPMVRSATSFQCDKATGLRGEEIKQLAPTNLPAENLAAARIRTVGMKNMLRDIQAQLC